MSLTRSASARRPDPLPTYEQFAARRREEAGMFWRAPAWARRQRRRYRRLVRENEASVERWRLGATDEGEQWKFVCDEAERKVSGEEYRQILELQADRPQLVLETLEGWRWWMYDERFFASGHDAGADDVVAVVRARRRRPRRTAPAAPVDPDPPIQVGDRRPPPAPGVADLPAEVRRYVYARDQGRCASCGDDGPDLRVDATTLRLMCADCVADGWLPTAARGPEPPLAEESSALPAADGHAGHDGAPDPAVPSPPRRDGATTGSPEGARPTRPRSRRRRRRRGR